MPEDGATLMVDHSYRPDGTRPGALICHSAAQRHYQQDVADWWPVPRDLARTGTCVCLACDLGDPGVEMGPTSAAYSWGNDHALACLTDAHRYLVGPDIGARDERVVLAGASMGAVLALNWALRHRGLVAGVVLGCPVVDLEAVARGPLAPSLAAAYGLEDPKGIADLGDHSPVSYASRLNGLPIRIYASRNDPVAADTDACESFAALVGGDAITVVDLGSCGHWPIATPGDDAVSFTRSVTGCRPGLG